jgi:hypothetical protein
MALLWRVLHGLLRRRTTRFVVRVTIRLERYLSWAMLIRYIRSESVAIVSSVAGRRERGEGVLDILEEVADVASNVVIWLEGERN